VLFEEGGVEATCEETLAQMQAVAQEHLAYTQDDHGLVDAHEQYTHKWKACQRRIHNLHRQLEEVPEKWREYNQRYCSQDTVL
jgi:nesprin-1